MQQSLKKLNSMIKNESYPSKKLPRKKENPSRRSSSMYNRTPGGRTGTQTPLLMPKTVPGKFSNTMNIEGPMPKDPGFNMAANNELLNQNINVQLYEILKESGIDYNTIKIMVKHKNTISKQFRDNQKVLAADKTKAWRVRRNLMVHKDLNKEVGFFYA